ncbi:hypothetical protein CVO74_06085 [Xanthomonas prunicola]|uniref:Uncharacterized protein n=1 Tax=Xanthomonas prunicola TaxID=2053930 RepID=A0A2N3RMA7_9XANT|nr:hypothetical protein XpruCFBP8353_00375 [Xanthomonas prunicola]PKV17908.1 hypothetical protein XpruCFBP8354_00375 [Xanthomonas prunicola]PKV22780.1 hypothetical protein CVO74_06085 [Xanthomonas prunicola]
MRWQDARAGDIAGAQQRFVPACNLGAWRAWDDHASACIDRRMMWMRAHVGPHQHRLTRPTTRAKTNRSSQ